MQGSSTPVAVKDLRDDFITAMEDSPHSVLEREEPTLGPPIHRVSFSKCRWTLSIWLLPVNPMLLITNIKLEKE